VGKISLARSLRLLTVCGVRVAQLTGRDIAVGVDIWGLSRELERHAVDQMLPPVIPTRLSNIDRRELSAAYPQSQKRECVRFASNLLRTNSQAFSRKTRRCDRAAFRV